MAIRPRTHSTIVTPELVHEIGRLMGYSIKQTEIAARLGCSQSTVARVQARLRASDAPALKCEA
jgi:Trp operon repressor